MLLALDTCIPSMRIAARFAPYPVRWIWAIAPEDADLVLSSLDAGGWTGGILLLSIMQGQREDTIQTALDSDDRIGPDFLTVVQSYWRPSSAPYLITWQPVKQDFHTGKLYRHSSRYREDKPSPFYTVYNPDPSTQIYSRKHGEMHLAFPSRRTYLGHEGGAVAVIHSDNKLQKITPQDLPLP
jgi:hypothetical protein